MTTIRTFGKLILSILVVTSLVMSCTKEDPHELPDCFTSEAGFDPQNCSTEGKCSFNYYPDKKLIIHNENDNLWMETEDGDNLIFHFQYDKNDSPYIADDEYSEAIWFEVSPTDDTFRIDLDILSQGRVLFNRMCFCVDGGFHWVFGGCIFGKKQNDNTWTVWLSIESTTNYATYQWMKKADFKSGTLD